MDSQLLDSRDLLLPFLWFENNTIWKRFDWGFLISNNEFLRKLLGMVLMKERKVFEKRSLFTWNSILIFVLVAITNWGFDEMSPRRRKCWWPANYEAVLRGNHLADIKILCVPGITTFLRTWIPTFQKEIVIVFLWSHLDLKIIEFWLNSWHGKCFVQKNLPENFKNCFLTLKQFESFSSPCLQ